MIRRLVGALIMALGIYYLSLGLAWSCSAAIFLPVVA